MAKGVVGGSLAVDTFTRACCSLRDIFVLKIINVSQYSRSHVQLKCGEAKNFGPT